MEKQRELAALKMEIRKPPQNLESCGFLVGFLFFVVVVVVAFFSIAANAVPVETALSVN